MDNLKKHSKIILDFTELEVYKLSFEAAMQIYDSSKKWPQDEKYSLIDQIRRSSRSVCSNIAEAWRKRKYPAHFVSKLSDSDAEAAETQVWLQFALHCEYIGENEYNSIKSKYAHICAMLTKMMRKPENWCK